MQNIITIPKKSLLFVGIDNVCPGKEVLNQHHSIVVATLSNNNQLIGVKDEDFDKRWIFQTEELTEDFTNGYLGKHILEIDSDKLSILTNRKTFIRDFDNKDVNHEKVLVCALPIQINEDNDPISRLINMIITSGIFSLRKIPDFFRYDITIKQIKRDNRNFWSKYGPDSKVITHYFKNRRFRNDDFKDTEDYTTIQQINTPQRVDGYKFANNGGDATGNWDGMEWKDELKQAMGIQPLDIKDYEAYATYEEMEEVFKIVSTFDDWESIIHDLLICFLKSFFCCHLIFKSKFIMMKLNFLLRYYYNEENKIAMNQINQSLIWGIYTIYTEELLIGGNLLPDHRCVFNAEEASMFPVFLEKNLYDSPYLCLPVDPNELNLKINFLGISRNGYYPGYGSSDSEHKFAQNGQKIRGIVSPYKVRMNVSNFTSGMLEGLDDPEIYLTGSGAEACLYDNPLFRRGHYQYDQIYPEKSLEQIYLDLNHYPHSDIDMVVFTNEERILELKANAVKKIVEQNVCTRVTLTRVNRTKFRISSPDIPRDIDLFMSNKSPPGLLFNYHISTCRAIIPMSDSVDFLSKESMVLSSMIISCNLGFCIDRRWFSSKTSLYDRILKQFSRGIGMLVNMYEIQMIKDYIDNSPKWNFLGSSMVELVNTQIGYAGNVQQIRYIKCNAPTILNELFKKQRDYRIGQYYVDANHVSVHTPNLKVHTINPGYNYDKCTIRNPRTGQFVNE